MLGSSLNSSIKLRTKLRTLAALFIRRPDKVDKMLKKIKYDDEDLSI